MVSSPFRVATTASWRKNNVEYSEQNLQMVISLSHCTPGKRIQMFAQILWCLVFNKATTFLTFWKDLLFYVQSTHHWNSVVCPACSDCLSHQTQLLKDLHSKKEKKVTVSPLEKGQSLSGAHTGLDIKKSGPLYVARESVLQLISPGWGTTWGTSKVLFKLKSGTRTRAANNPVCINSSWNTTWCMSKGLVQAERRCMYQDSEWIIRFIWFGARKENSDLCSQRPESPDVLPEIVFRVELHGIQPKRVVLVNAL